MIGEIVQSSDICFNTSLTEIRAIFSATKCYLWLKDVLTKHENHELYFGEASVLLHNVLLNDPKPYRIVSNDL